MRKFLSVILFFGLTAPAIADECPMGYEPTEYTQLEYIESTGTQYIDTGVFPRADDRIECDFSTSSSGQDSKFIYGFWSSDKAKQFGINTFGDWNKNRATLYVYTFDGTRSFQVNNLNINKSVLKNYQWYLNDEFLMQTSSTTVYDTSIYLFAAGVSESYFGVAKIYKYKHYQNNTLVRNFIPAKRNSDGEIGMYDTVTGHFFTNEGTGIFIAGPETLMVITENTCFPCPPNTYKDFVGNSDCTPCPDTFSSPSGATSINECGRILHVGDYIAHMPFGRRTEHGLCTMFDGKKYCADMYEKQ